MKRIKLVLSSLMIVANRLCKKIFLMGGRIVGQKFDCTGGTHKTAR